MCCAHPMARNPGAHHKLASFMDSSPEGAIAAPSEQATRYIFEGLGYAKVRGGGVPACQSPVAIK